ncbi:glycosyltransferase [Marilutibacter aestuarii]|nr:glycosyltransferase [Lysobacter aestuarii]
MTVSEKDVELVLTCGLFDADWYMARHPDLSSAKHAARHYLSRGGVEDPGPAFSASAYLSAHPDVAEAGIDPLLHFVRYGRDEGRETRLADPAAALRSAPGLARGGYHESLVRVDGVFDEAFYLSTNADVAETGQDPIRHYLQHGATEGRNPNPFFDTIYYRDRHMGDGDALNPLVHYICSPSRANVDTSLRFDGAYYLARYPDVREYSGSPLGHFVSHGVMQGRVACFAAGDAWHAGMASDPARVPCTVVVAVHDAHDQVVQCLDALFRHTRLDGGDQVLLVDDASTDPRIAPLLEQYASRPGARVLANPVNLGYTTTVNQAIARCGPGDVVLLNSDTRVGPQWLVGLKQAASSDPSIGTVTAVSNDAGVFSIAAPENALERFGTDALARVALGAGALPFEVPTGNGFCLYIRRSMLDRVGGFDASAFPVGYGEENDFCMRAGNDGWRHLVAPSVYVWHSRSSSFGERRGALARQGFDRVRAMHPGYEAAIAAIPAAHGLKDASYRLGRQFRALESAAVAARPRILFVISTRSGGTPQTNLDLMRAISDEFEPFALSSDGQVLEVLGAGSGGYESVDRIALAEPLRFQMHSSAEYDRVVRALMVRMGIEVLHVRHLAWHGLGLPGVARGLGIPVLMSFHDYYSVCPTVNLLDGEGALHVQGVERDGSNPLWDRDPTALPMTPVRLASWKERMQRALQPVSAFVTTSPAARALIVGALPAIGDRANDFHVIPHGRDFERFLPPAVDRNAGVRRPLRILLPGNFSRHKGADLVRGLKALDVGNQLELHLLGRCPPELEALVVAHGCYARDEFVDLVEGIAPDLAAVLSVWPETHCHTLTESWACGLPVVGVDVGAVAERVRTHGGGWLIDFPASPDDLYQLLRRLAMDPGERASRARQVADWQEGAGRREGVTWMADRYRALYRSCLRGHAPARHEGNP